MSDTRYILAIDQGTTGTTVLIVDDRLNVVGRHTEEFPQVFPQPGWVEHDPECIIRSVQIAIDEALIDAEIKGADVAAIGITNQRETTVLWDRGSDVPVHNAIVWQCRRTADICASLKAKGHEDLFRARTGLTLDPYFSGTKLCWLLDNVKGARARAEAGQLAFGTIDTFLVWRLTGGVAHVTDVSNASRTLLMNLSTLQWDDTLRGILRVPESVLPSIRTSSEIYGKTKGFTGLPDGIPVAGMAGDQQAALFGQACFEVGEAKCTYGTGAFLLMNTGATPVPSQNGLLTTVAWQIDDHVAYALEGSAFVAGAAVQWLRDGLKIIDAASQIEELACEVEDADGVYFVPALTGLGAPYWQPDARGVICGITRGTTAAHIARATLNGIALQNHDVLRAMEKDLGKSLACLRVDGGAAANNLLMQIQADVLEVSIVRPAMLQTTAMGAAMLAGLGVSIWKSFDELKATWQSEREFEPSGDAAKVAALLDGWKAAVAKA